MKNLFAYGTLMSERVLLLVSGHCFSWQFGILKGYGRRSVTGQNYPAIIPEKESFVDGILYWDIPDSAWKSLDRYEGEMYEKNYIETIETD